jgi:hypothetical protein
MTGIVALLISAGTWLHGLAPLLAIGGGPIGVVIAWLGSKAKDKAVKWGAIIIGLLLLVIVSVSLTIYVKNLQFDRVKLVEITGTLSGLEAEYGCDTRANPAERHLTACLAARDREAAQAVRDEIERQRRAAAAAQALLDQQTAQAEAVQHSMDEFIDGQAVNGDGPVPKVLLDTWARRRQPRGK